MCSLVSKQYREKRRYKRDSGTVYISETPIQREVTKRKKEKKKRERELIRSTIENTTQDVRDERTCEGGCCVQTPCPVSIAEVLCLPQFLVGIQTH